MNADAVLTRRLRVQRLTSAPLDDPADVVRLLTCVQAQDAPLARYSLGMRTASGTDAEIQRAIDDGRIVRTHILRPTWHYVAPEDLRWILALTSPKVESSLGARHRGLGLDDALVDGTFASLAELLAGRTFLTRRAIHAALVDSGSPLNGEQVGHLLLLAELRALVCSGPLDRGTHTYGLVDELVPPAPERDRTDAVRELVARFFAGHGPAAVTDLTRWTKLTQVEIRGALGELDNVERIDVDGMDLWFQPRTDPGTTTKARAFLLPVFDEAYLTYPRLNFPRSADHPDGDAPSRFAEAGGGVVVVDRRDVGRWKRTNAGGRTVVTLALAPSVTSRQRTWVAHEVERLAAFTGRTAEM